MTVSIQLGENIHAVNKTTESQLLASKKTVLELEVNTKRIRYLYMYREDNAGQTCYIITNNKSF